MGWGAHQGGGVGPIVLSRKGAGRGHGSKEGLYREVC